MRCADEVTIVGHSVFVRGEIEYYGDEDVPPRAGHSPTECRLFVPEADIATTPDRKGAAMACLMAELF